MRKHHYELIACSLSTSKPQGTGYGRQHFDASAISQWRRDCMFVARMLAQQDPEFRSDLFLRDCGIVQNQGLSYKL